MGRGLMAWILVDEAEGAKGRRRDGIELSENIQGYL